MVVVVRVVVLVAMAVEAEQLGVGDEGGTVVVLVTLTATRPQLVGVGLAVEDVHAVATLGRAARAGEQLAAVLHVVVQSRQARRIRLADPAREAAADSGLVVADQVHGVQHVPLTHLHPLLPLLALLVDRAVAVDEG